MYIFIFLLILGFIYEIFLGALDMCCLNSVIELLISEIYCIMVGNIKNLCQNWCFLYLLMILFFINYFFTTWQMIINFFIFYDSFVIIL